MPENQPKELTPDAFLNYTSTLLTCSSVIELGLGSPEAAAATLAAAVLVAAGNAGTLIMDTIDARESQK